MHDKGNIVSVATPGEQPSGRTHPPKRAGARREHPTETPTARQGAERQSPSPKQDISKIFLMESFFDNFILSLTGLLFIYLCINYIWTCLNTLNLYNTSMVSFLISSIK